MLSVFLVLQYVACDVRKILVAVFFACETTSSRHCAGGVPLWQFIDFVVTHPTPLFMMLLPFIKYKVSQKCVLGGFLDICTPTNISKTTIDCDALQLSVIVPCGRRACR